MPKRTRTSAFGVSRREGHDSSSFYQRSLYQDQPASVATDQPVSAVFTGPVDWVDRIYCQSAESMPLPEGSVALAFTSPPYNVGKDYDQDQSLQEYLGLIQRVGEKSTVRSSRAGAT